MWFFRRSSDHFHANYERTFARLKSEISRLQENLHVRQKRKSAIKHSILYYGGSLTVVAAAYASWVVRQPEGTFTSKSHFLRVLPMVLIPIITCIAYLGCIKAIEWMERRDQAAILSLEGKLRKMVSELKDSSQYDKVLRLLEKYDPDYTAATPQKLRESTSGQSPARAGKTPGPPRTQVATPRSGGMRQMPFVDTLGLIANSLVGDNPALVETLHKAVAEANSLKSELAACQAQRDALQLEKSELLQKLRELSGGEEDIDDEGGSMKPLEEKDKEGPLGSTDAEAGSKWSVSEMKE